MGDHPEEHDEGLAGRVHALSKRNILVVVVLFVSSVVTAVSTLATAWNVALKSTADWQPPEYRKLKSLRGGHTIERFTKILGPASYRIPYPDFVGLPDRDTAGLTKHVFRPRDEYRVEVITDRSGSTLVYAVTSCSPDFDPPFVVDRFDAKHRFTVTLGSRLSEVHPETATVYRWITATGARESAVSQRVTTGDDDGKREYAWGSNDVCPLTSQADRQGSDSLWDDWEKWQAGRTPDDVGVYSAERTDRETLSLMEQSVVNVYAESHPGGSISLYYPALLGVNRFTAD
ncbi:hypothetical protein ACWENA_36355 [Streptomyces sp. NPDC004779]